MSFERVGHLLAAADRLEAMVWALPQWDPQAGERWDDFLERRYEAELDLADELDRVSGCRLSMCSRRKHVELVLAGFTVRSKQGLAHACLDWVEKVRATHSGLGVILGHRFNPPKM